MNRNTSYYRDKKLLSIHRERNSLWKRMWQFVDINPPIPRGWIRHWRLTPKARERHDASVLQIILNEIDNKRYHWRRSFVSGRRKQRRMIENSQTVSALRERRWSHLGWPEEWKKHFQKVPVNLGKHDQTIAYKFLREDLFELFIERHYIWNVRLLDPAAESRSAELDMYLEHRGKNHRLTKLLDNGWSSGPNPKQKILARLEQRRIRKVLEGIWDAEVSRSTSIYSPRQLKELTSN